MKAQIICKTDAYHAARNANFRDHNTSYVVDEFDSLEEANKALLDKFNAFADDEGRYFSNWGLAAAWRGHISLKANRTFGDGTRSFNYDVYTYSTKVTEDE